MTDNTQENILIGILAGEASGDMLGASLIRSLRVYYPDAEFVGIGGPLMIAEGFQSLHEMDRLSVMGFVEPLKRLPELIKIRRSVLKYFAQARPAIFVGIDSPDFNLGIEKQLKSQGISTVHYVSPSVWAWRQGRVEKIRQSVDEVLCLLPFEKQFYDDHDVPATFVGHSMADEIAIQIDKTAAKRKLALDNGRQTLAILPGSRAGEIERMAPVFFSSIICLRREGYDLTGLNIVVAANSEIAYERIRQLADEAGVPVNIFLGNARDVLAAADMCMLASGTATLECMLMKTPMVVAYRVESFTYWLAKKLVKTKYISLPNLLADEQVVEEFIQDDADPNKLSEALRSLLDSPSLRQEISGKFEQLHRQIRLDASSKAAKAINDLINLGRYTDGTHE